MKITVKSDNRSVRSLNAIHFLAKFFEQEPEDVTEIIENAYTEKGYSFNAFWEPVKVEEFVNNMYGYGYSVQLGFEGKHQKPLVKYCESCGTKLSTIWCDSCKELSLDMSKVTITEKIGMSIWKAVQVNDIQKMSYQRLSNDLSIINTLCNLFYDVFLYDNEKTTIVLILKEALKLSKIERISNSQEDLLVNGIWEMITARIEKLIEHLEGNKNE